MEIEELKKENERLKNELKIYKLEKENKNMQDEIDYIRLNKELSKDIITKEQKIINIIKDNGGKIDKNELIILLSKEYKEGRWIFGSGKTTILINELIVRGVIKEINRERNNGVLVCGYE